MTELFETDILNIPQLYSGNYTHVGIACSCGGEGTTACAFIFTHTLIGYEVNEPLPLSLPYG